MRKAIIILFILMVIFLIGCEKAEEAPKEKKEVCGDNVCQDNEKEMNKCPADCGGFEGITKVQCEKAGGHWNECGSPCAGTDAEICIQVCQAQCECGGIAGFNCPEEFKCRLTGKIADEMGVCVKR